MANYTQDTVPAAAGAPRSTGWSETDGVARTGVSWPAIFAGATAAAALSLIMLLLGAGTGLGVSSPWGDEGAEAKTIGIAVIFWITFTQIASSGLGGSRNLPGTAIFTPGLRERAGIRSPPSTRCFVT